MSAFSYEINKEGIAILTFDLVGEKVNKLTTPVMDEFDRLLDELAARKEIKALVIKSGKDGHFIVGADIAEIREITDPQRGEALAHKGQDIFRKLESLPYPTVAAIHGPCLGGGIELVLACSYRVISNDPKTALGQPEVRIGIIPGFGGTQRLPRLVGLTNALDIILPENRFTPGKRRRSGLPMRSSTRKLC
jgi:3-hydroxyacyl-CoA dehydrogenase/enoyl-CoA hydratase/3-hydroxybutyryl-CoA epimerase